MRRGRHEQLPPSNSPYNIRQVRQDAVSVTQKSISGVTTVRRYNVSSGLCLTRHPSRYRCYSMKVVAGADPPHIDQSLDRCTDSLLEVVIGLLVVSGTANPSIDPAHSRFADAIL